MTQIQTFSVPVMKMQASENFKSMWFCPAAAHSC